MDLQDAINNYVESIKRLNEKYESLDTMIEKIKTLQLIKFQAKELVRFMDMQKEAK